jgi:hypothetical protein
MIISDDLSISGQISGPTVVNAQSVATYAAMIAIGGPSKGVTVFKVLADENKGTTYSIYQWWSTGERMWIAANKDN